MAGIYGKAKKRNNPHNPGTAGAFAESDLNEITGVNDRSPYQVNVPDDPSKPPEFENPTQTEFKKPDRRHPNG